MLYEKRAVLGILSRHADSHRVDQAAEEMPEIIDSERHAELLARYGLDSERLRREVRETDHGDAGSRVKPPGFEAGPG